MPTFKPRWKARASACRDTRREDLESIVESIREGDEAGFRRALRRRLRGSTLIHWAARTGIPLRTLYRLRNGEGGTRFDNVLRLLKELAKESA